MTDPQRRLPASSGRRVRRKRDRPLRPLRLLRGLRLLARTDVGVLNGHTYY